ncbi:RHS repeat domain-containing protein [Pseudanabaena sp. BC1403]|uniref:RHS repeat domain-containing protein n=1 Tax=Pseudanabaena sp. BC1403 TaxID=2043171 RepID=UPI000CD9BD4A|nr:RHS repeat domain-containing protein [Pseudanabaena sp. BC1403]
MLVTEVRICTETYAVKDANLHTTEYAYDNLGELTSVKLANQATTIYDYDNLGRLF